MSMSEASRTNPTKDPKNEAQLFFCLGKDGPEGKSGRSVWVPVSFGAAVLGNA